MRKDIYIGKRNVSAEIYYCNVLNKYNIGLTIGGFYTILSKSFNTEEEAQEYIYDNFNMYDSFGLFGWED